MVPDLSVLAITGGTGFVGRTTVNHTLDSGHSVRALARRDQTPRDGVAWIRGDLSDAAALEELVRGSDAVLHIAGVVNAPDRAGFDAANIGGTQNVIAAMERAGTRRLVLVSSLSAREPQLSLYGASKRGGEDAVRASSLDWTIVRPPAIYGPHDTEMFDLFRAAKAHLVPMPPRGRTSIVHVDDLARLLVTLAEQPTSGAIYEPDDGRIEGWEHAELATAIADAVGTRALVPRVPAPLLRLAARADRLMRGDKAKLTLDRVGYMVHPDWVASADRRPPSSLWQPQIETRAGLRDTARWYEREGWL